MQNTQISRVQLILPEIKELIAQKKLAELKGIWQEFEPIEIAEVVKLLKAKERQFLFNNWDKDFAADIFEHLHRPLQISLLKSLTRSERAELLNKISSDDRADLFSALPPDKAKEFLGLMEQQEARDVRELISYDSNTAGGRMTSEFARLLPDDTAGKSLETVRSSAKDLETIYYLYVLDKQDRLIGVLSLKELVVADPAIPISRIMHRHVISVPVNMDQEHAAQKISRYDFLALPVVDRQKRMKGIITVDDILDVMEDESTEDMYHFGAVTKPLENYLQANVFSVARQRISWLLVLVVASLFSGLIMEKNAMLLSTTMTLAFFIPLLMNTGGGAGTQAATVIVRGLATGEVKLQNVWRIIRKELLIGILIGCVIGILAALRALVFQGDVLLGLSVALTMVAVISVATTIGSLLPLLFKKLGVDPAISSGPLISTIIDITTLLIYFRIAIWIFNLG